MTETPDKYKPNPKLTDLYAMGEAKAEKVKDAGYTTIADIEQASIEELEDIDGVLNAAHTWKWQIENDAIGHQPPIFR